MKKIIYILTLVLIAPVMFSQEGYYGENLDSNLYAASQVIGNPTPQSPDAAAFQKVNFVPVSNYTGRASIGVPIYTISVGNMNVPISLSYNSSGVKVNDMASSVGLNWSLNAGGMISRMIKGINDFTPINFEFEAPEGWLNRLYDSNSNIEREYEQDAQPDIFVANAPGLSTKYICLNYINYINGEFIVGNPTIKELEDKGNIINILTEKHATSTGVRGIKKFTNTDIISTNGIKYSFGSEEKSRSTSAFESRYASIFNLSYINNSVSGYRLDKMFDPSTNQTIDFEYEEYSVNFYDNIKQGGGVYNTGSNIKFRNNGYSEVTYPVLQRLKKIVFEGGYVEFIYGLNRLDNTDEKALIEIKVIGANGVIVKHVKFAYSYFQTVLGGGSIPQSKRLRLDRVYEVDINSNELPGHTFTYDTGYSMAPRGSYAHDFLGYNNGSYSSSNTNPIPKYYLSYNNSVFSKYIKILPFYNPSAILVPGNFSLEANQNYAKTYSLTKITFPTGGSNEYEYELNTFYHEGAVRSGGGIRVKSQKLNNGKGNIQIIDYAYEDGSIANFPVFGFFRGGLPANGATSFSQIGIGLNTFISPQSQIEFTQGAFVGYRKVTVKDRVNNGYMKFFYSSPNVGMYKNIKPTITYDTSHLESANWSVIQSPSLLVDKDFLRGKILSEETYNKDGEIRLEKEYIYTQKEFSTIKLKFLNKSSSDPLDGCYNEGWFGYNLKYYNGKCGGYFEEVDLPIARNLLTTVITRDYQAGNIVYTQGGTENVPYTFKTIQRYSYDLQYPLLIKESKEITVCEETTQGGQECASVNQDYDYQVSKEITYPLKGMISGHEISTLPFAGQLVAKNRISTPLRIEFKNKDSQIIAQEDHIYKDFGNNVLALEKINFISREGSIAPSETITKRDIRGHIVEYQKKNGIYVTKLYGYDDDYLVAEIENSRHAVVLATLPTLSIPYNQGTFADSESLMILMDELRVELPETSITSYTYEPLIGVTSITDPSGYTSYYDYDDFNKLQYIKNKDGDVLKSYKYHYKGQEEEFPVPTYTVTKVIDGGVGSVSITPSIVDQGGFTDITATPGSGYEVEYIKVGTTSYPFTNNIARIDNITSDTEVHVKFKTLTTTFSVSPTGLFFDFIDVNKTITVTASGSWTVSKSDFWIVISTTTGSGNGTFTIRPYKNLGSFRSGTVTVVNGGITKTISITQSGDGGIE